MSNDTDISTIPTGNPQEDSVYMGFPNLERINLGLDKKKALLITDIISFATSVIGIALADGFEDKKLKWGIIIATTIGNTITTNEWKKHIEMYNPDSSKSNGGVTR